MLDKNEEITVLNLLTVDEPTINRAWRYLDPA